MFPLSSLEILKSFRESFVRSWEPDSGPTQPFGYTSGIVSAPLALNDLGPSSHPLSESELPELSRSGTPPTSFSESEATEPELEFELELRTTLLPFLFLPIPTWELSGGFEEEESRGNFRIGTLGWEFA